MCGGSFLSYPTHRVKRRPLWYFYTRKCSFSFPPIVCRRLFSLFQSREATCTSNEKHSHRVLGSYGKAINLPKFEIYCSRNVPDTLKNSIMNIMGVQSMLDTKKYLGLPSMIGRDWTITFSYIKDWAWQKKKSALRVVSVYPKQVASLESHSFICNEYFSTAYLID